MYRCARYERSRLRWFQWYDLRDLPQLVDQMRVAYGQEAYSWGSWFWRLLVGESGVPLRQESDVDPFEQLADDELVTELTQRLRYLHISDTSRYPDWWPQDTPQEPAYQVAEAVVHSGIKAAQEKVRQLYQRLLQFTDQKEQALAEVYRQLEALQSSEACQQARAEAKIKRSETGLEQGGQASDLPYAAREQSTAFDWGQGAI